VTFAADPARTPILLRRGRLLEVATLAGNLVGKTRTCQQLANPVLITEGRVTVIDGLLAVAVVASQVRCKSAGVGSLWWAG
jgi:hypothetical protein